MINVELSSIWSCVSLPQLLSCEKDLFDAHLHLRSNQPNAPEFLGWLGSEGPRADLYREFAAKLEELLGEKIVLWDERRTTIEAHQILSDNNYHGKKRKKTVDAVAASLILEGYLNYLRTHKE